MIIESNSIENRFDWAEKYGYTFCRDFDTTSSAGDWSCLVSKDGYVWNIMYQENCWPSIGFDRYIETDHFVCGTVEEAIKIFTMVSLLQRK